MNFEFLDQYNNIYAISLITACVIFLLTLIVLIELSKTLGKNLFPKQFKPVVKHKAQKGRSKWVKLLTRSVELNEEETILMDHEYDGIKELDNDLPPWWKYGFYFTIFWAICYFSYYTLTGIGPSSKEELSIATKKAQQEINEYNRLKAENVTAETALVLVNPSEISKGQRIFKVKCSPCHGELGQGVSGPNLTDKYWLHGGSMQDIFTTITNGIPAKGMIAWGEKISSKDIERVASYIISLEGSLPPNAKAPQGDIYVREVESENNGE